MDNTKVKSFDVIVEGEAAASSSGLPPEPAALQDVITEHLMETPEVVSKFATNFNTEFPKQSKGLTDDEANSRLKRYGENKLTPPKQTPEWKRFLNKFLDRFIVLLLLAGTLSMTLAGEDIMNLYLGIILYVVCIVACTLSYIEEGKVSALMGTFKSMLPSSTKVIRNGAVRDIPAENLVVGDIVLLKGGDKVPADVRLLEASEFVVECSSLTGESEPIDLKVDICKDANAPPNEATNIAFSSSLVLGGDAVGVVIRTSDLTLLGRIANAAMNVEKGKTTLELEIDRLVNFISVLAFAMAIAVFVASVAQGVDPAFAFVNGFVVIIIANVPQGLQLTVMVALNVTGRKLAQRNVYVKSLNTIETLGSASCICTDKTGTLTQNVMSVAHLWVGEQVLHGEQLTQGDTSRIHWEQNQHIQDLHHIAAVCNKAVYEDPSFTLFNGSTTTKFSSSSILTGIAKKQSESLLQSLSKISPDGGKGGKPKGPVRRPSRANNVSPGAQKDMPCTGDASDIGLMKFCDTIVPVHSTRRDFDVLCEIPFNSKIKYSACVVRPQPEAKDQRRHLWIKGAPEIILSMCTKYLVNGEEKATDAEFREKYDQVYRSFAGQGERVLGFARIVLDLEQYPPSFDGSYKAGQEGFPELKELTFVGLMSLVDPPRPGVKEAVETCRKAGVRVIMVTGDHPLTAEAIARKVSIIGEYFTKEEVANVYDVPIDQVDPKEVGAIVIHGHSLQQLSEQEWDNILAHKEIVFARTTPEQKLEIVKHCQRTGDVVAVTGDGVNDAPALRQANIGIAMGTVGSDVSRDAADVILITNDWACIVSGIEEGRVIFDNLVKSVAYTLTHLWPEVFPSILALVFGFPFLISSILVLMIDLGTEMFPAVSIAYEPPQKGLMLKPPRNMKTDRLVTKRLVSYAYLEAGLAELLAALIGAFIVFWTYGIPLSYLPFSSNTYWRSDAPTLSIGDHTYTAAQQLDIINKAHAGYFIGLVGSQAFHIWVCRSRETTIFELGFQNIVAVYGVLIEVLILVLIVYLPYTQEFFTTSNPPAIVWTTPLIFVALVYPFVEGRKLWVRNYPDGKVAKYFAW